MYRGLYKEMMWKTYQFKTRIWWDIQKEKIEDKICGALTNQID